MCVCVCVPRIQCTLIPGNVIIHTRMFRCFRLFFWHRFDMLIKIRHKILISCTHSTFFSLSRARLLNFFVCNFFQRYCCWCRCQCRQYRTSSLHRTLFAIRSIHFSWIPEIFIFRCSIYKYNAKRTTTATSSSERMETTPANTLAMIGERRSGRTATKKQQNEKKSHYATRSIINLLACKVYSFVELNVISMPKMWYQMNQTTRGWADNTLTMWAVCGRREREYRVEKQQQYQQKK